MHIVIVTGERELHLNVDGEALVLEVKEQLELLLGIPKRRQTLVFDDDELEDWTEIENFGVEENSRITLTINSEENRFKLFVRILEREAILLNIEEMDTVLSLKERIQKRIDAPRELELALFHKCTEMRDDQRLCEYRVSTHSEIIATLKPRLMMPPPKRLSFVVKIGSNSFPFDMTAGHTVSDLRKQVLDNICLPQGDYVFVHKQRIMEDNQSLLSLGVQDGDSIDVIRRKEN
ncbi:hypothetical protein MRB53_029460 [Persea americana]|uniref:Uncharacterized protein n=1 Tax=Persea americana TaxID=3435 RepID=A0ACC2KIT5_PERAE|nr:hypothetical protein MRB53_029460 [Persea americana]